MSVLQFIIGTTMLVDVPVALTAFLVHRLPLPAVVTVLSR